MKTLLRHICLLLTLPVLFVLGGCYDDLLDAPYPGEYPEGETEISVQMDFEPFETVALGTRASGNGKIMDRMDDLCVLAYDLEGNLMEGFPVQITKEDHSLDVHSVKRNDSDASNGQSAESSTLQATFRMKVPYGRYYIYGVANLGTSDKAGNRTGSTYDELTSGRYASVIGKRQDFLKARTDWDETNLYNNCEMLGYFSNGKEKQSPSTGLQTNEKTVSIDRAGMTLHSWLRRCASKITVDFDASGLRDNIYIYIKRVTLHDIPNKCAIGSPNAANDKEPDAPHIITYKNSDYRPDNKGAYIDYGTGDDYKAWPKISKGSPKIKDGSGVEIDFHKEDAQAMFLYENMQGETEDDKTNKEQHPNDDGTVIGAGDNKDNVEYGSYIEVEAYYQHSSASQVSQGKIIYRFMLGKDVLNNFDVERNHHYKITMCPRGNGNDVDWHIEYKEEGGFEYKDPYYVSYLYNHDSTMHFRYTPPKGQTVTKIDAEIVGNNWWPDNATSDFVYMDVVNKQNPLKDEEKKDPLNASFTHNRFTDKSGVSRTRYLGNGFLSLRATSATVITQEMTSDFTQQPWESNGFHQAKNTRGQYMNDNYFYGLKKDKADGDDFTYENDPNLTDRSRRTYHFDGTHDPSNNGRETYEMQALPDGSCRFNLPMFTRAKNLVKASGYTGNNLYEASTRTAYVRVTVHLSGGGTDTQVLRVLQVPRITNPKGIYRKSGNNENFEVILMQKDGDNGTTFEPFDSDGPWMAEVISNDANFINLNGRSTIKGSTGSPVKFNVRFNKMNRDDKVRNAVIRVRYHNYTCVHLIFVRQGYSSLALTEDGPEWHTTNLVYDEVEGVDPRDEGSLFKYGNLTVPIDVNCNVYTPLGMYPDQGTFGPRPGGKYDIATSDITKFTPNGQEWGKIYMNANGFDDNSGVATMNDFVSLYTNSNIEQGFGVLYADGATTTQRAVADVYGYCRHDKPAVRDKRGMCGVFVYYWDRDDASDNCNCRNIFFPIGRSGYGHRKQRDDSGTGTLRYACAQRSGYFPSSLLPWEPLFYDLFKRKGAIYYARKMQDGVVDINGLRNDQAIGLDMNFFSFDFNLITSANVTGGEDACFLRVVGHQKRGRQQ